MDVGRGFFEEYGINCGIRALPVDSNSRHACKMQPLRRGRVGTTLVLGKPLWLYQVALWVDLRTTLPEKSTDLFAQGWGR